MHWHEPLTFPLPQIWISAYRDHVSWGCSRIALMTQDSQPLMHAPMAWHKLHTPGAYPSWQLRRA